MVCSMDLGKPWYTSERQCPTSWAAMLWTKGFLRTQASCLEAWKPESPLLTNSVRQSSLIRYDSVKPECHEAPNCSRPEGFAINGGKGWADVVFDNHFINVIGEVAIAMGNYFFTSAADGSKTKVEYTFGYTKNSDGKEGFPRNTSL